jgi:hypothetical protein
LTDDNCLGNFFQQHGSARGEICPVARGLNIRNACVFLPVFTNTNVNIE